jgi:squalene synthase HpnC
LRRARTRPAPKLTQISGDEHVIICIKLASRAEIEIVTRDKAGAEATLAPKAAADLPQPGAAAPRPPAREPAATMAEKAAAENFPVALRLLPRRHRDHLMAVYTYARTVDDVGDLGPPGDRLRLLGDLEEDLSRLYARGESLSRQPAVRGLAATVADCHIPMEPFLHLIRANQQDQLVNRYETFDELLGYCALSANPVGRIVLHIFGCSTPDRARLSDSVCTGLQIIEHLQDVAEDLKAGRIYLPAADMHSHGCTEEDLASREASPCVRRLIAFEADRAAALIDAGAPLVGDLRAAARIAVAGYVAGGRAALVAMDHADYDVLTAAPRPTKGRTVLELASALVRGR